nr:YhjD/YihY/BrkB family envelope integrity protein [Mesorhizobium sp.]
MALLITASGVLGEMQQSLDEMWKVKPDRMSLSRLVRARAANLGLMAALGFLLLVSLAASAAVSALGETAVWRADHQSRQPLVSFALIALLSAAIYKVLPDRTVKWRDVAVGSAALRCCSPSAPPAR